MGAEHAKSNGRGRNPPPAGYRWKPGQSGNPRGRPKGSGLTDRLRALLEKDDGAALNAIAAAVVEAAKAGDAAFVRMLWERIDGPVSARVEVEAEGGRLLVLPDDEFERFRAGEPGVLLAWGVPAGWESRVKICRKSDMELLG